MTAKEIAFPSALECLQFRCNEQWSRDHPDFEVGREFPCHRGFHCGLIPAVRKTQNLFIQGHDVEYGSTMNPAAQGCVLAAILPESQTRANGRRTPHTRR